LFETNVDKQRTREINHEPCALQFRHQKKPQLRCELELDRELEVHGHEI
jgi:hypothetical protein